MAITLPLTAIPQETIRGEVVDSVCWVRQGARGADHRGCAQRCADGGIPLALLQEGTDELIWVTSSQSMTGANEELKAHASHTVELTGEFIERDGVRIFVIESVQHISAD